MQPQRREICCTVARPADAEAQGVLVSNTSLTTKVSNSRGWTLALGIAAAVLAAILLIAYLVQYRSSVNDSTAPTPGLVAKNLIPKGTSGTVIAEKQLFQAATLAEGRPEGRRNLGPVVPERPCGGRRHLPRASRSRRPTSASG